MTSDDVKNTTKDIEKAGRAAQDAAQEKASQVAEKTQDYAANVSDKTKDVYGRAKEKVRDASERLPDSASETFAAGQDALSRGATQLADQVAKQPIEALFLAGAIGFLVGWATNRS